MLTALRFLKGVWRWLVTNPTIAAIIALIALCGLLWLQNTSLRSDVAQAKRDTAIERKAHKETKQAYQTAQDDAKAKHAANIAAYEAKERNHAIEMDKAIRSNVAVALASLRGRKAVGSNTSRPGVAETSTAAVDIAGDGGMPVLDVGIARNEDDMRCTVNTIKAIGAREYLLTLPD